MNTETDGASSRDTLLAMALQVQALEAIVNELQQLVQSKDAIEAQVAAQYESRISELEEENEKLTHGILPSRPQDGLAQLTTC